MRRLDVVVVVLALLGLVALFGLGVHVGRQPRGPEQALHDYLEAR